MRIGRIEINNFRSIAEEVLIVEDLKRFNLIIGKNNSGKSNTLKILPFINDIVQNPQEAWFEGDFEIGWRNSISDPAYLTELFYGSDDKKIINLSFSVQLEEDEKNEFITGLPHITEDFSREMLSKADDIVFVFTIRKNHGQNTLIYRLSRIQIGQDLPLFDESSSSIRNNYGQLNSPSDFSEITYQKQKSLGTEYQYINNILQQTFNLLKNKLRIIWAVRKVSASYSMGQGNQNVSKIFNSLGIEGIDAIDIISDLRNPNDNHRYNSKRYKDLNKFVSDLVDEKITLVPNGNKSELNVEKESDNSVLSIKSLGSSIEELTAIATTLINYPDNSIVAIEEPEVHLDPILQRKFIRYLKKIPNISQFFFSSHSNIFINEFAADDSRIYRTSYQNNMTKIEKIEKVDNKSINLVLDDLGVKASDLLQSNGIIWVEGPSERIYLNKWLKLKNANLIEGIHYSIMFYGGRLLSNLSVGEEAIDGDLEPEVEIETSEFIDLLKINRNIVLIMDSDRERATDDINATKKRVIEEIGKLDSNKAMTWVTQGREIENYITPKYFESMFGIKGIDSYTRINDKVKEKNATEGGKSGYVKLEGAKNIINQIDESEFEQKNDLSEKLAQLIGTVREWNIWL